MTAICFVLLCTVVICLYAIWRTYIYIENAEAKVAEYKRLAEATIKARGSRLGCWADKAGTQSVICTLCGSEWDRRYVHRLNYCPGCGAKMVRPYAEPVMEVNDHV